MIGASPRRKEDLRLLTGAGRFLDDLTRPGLAHLGVVRSVHAHARVLKVTTHEALALPGVLAVWAAADLPEVARPMPEPFGARQKGRPYTRPVLAGEVAKYVGEAIAVVVAESAPLAEDAMEQVRIDYEPLPPLASAEEALRSPVRIHENWPDNRTLPVRGEVGDVAVGFAPADVVIHERFAHPRLAAMPIETRGVLAYRDAESGTLVVWSSTQNPYHVRDTVAAVLGLPVETVRVCAPDVGGGFGPKGSVYPEEVLVAAAALRLGRPVKWVETRREHLMATGHDREQIHDAGIGFTRDGHITALEDSFLADVGAYPLEGDGLTKNTVNHLPGPYRVPNYRCDGVSVVTNKTPTSAYRGAGRPEACFVMERLMDIGARRLGLDPAEIRRRNLVRPEEMPYRPGLTYKDGVPIAYDPGDFPAAFERALELIDYAGWRARQAAQPADAVKRIGIGLACYAQGTGLGPYEGATVRVDPSGKVYVYVGVAGQGQGHATTLAQIAAAELGARFDDVVLMAGDTTLFPYGMGTGGSRVIANAGPAVAQSARAVREKACRVAADLLECAPEDVRIEDGRVHVAGVRDRFVTLGRVAHAATKTGALRSLGEPGLNSCTYFHPETVTWAFGTQAAVVEVDAETFAVRLLAYAIVHDPGRAINPVIVEAQLQGGAVQGLAAGLFEYAAHDATGQVLTGSFMDYAIPRADDLPSLPVALRPHASAINELGAKGVGESGAIPGAAAIANAVEDALPEGSRPVGTTPVTPFVAFGLAPAPRSE